MKDSLTKQGLAYKYTFDHPSTLSVPKVLNTFTGIKAVFSDPARFKVLYEKSGYGSIMMFDEMAQ
jgi:linoleate 10R-lipoxygenase